MPITKAICNKGFSGNSRILPRSNFGVGGQESSPQSLTAYSLNRWLQLDEKREETKRSSIVVRAKVQRHEKEERDGKQAATNNMYSQCNELF
jgi:hypothetical protein